MGTPLLPGHPWITSFSQRAWTGIGAAGEGGALFAQLMAAYAEPQHATTRSNTSANACRHSTVRSRWPSTAEVEIALWFHDAVYDVKGHDNERCSADWARDALRDAGVDTGSAQRVHDLVMATRAPQCRRHRTNGCWSTSTCPSWVQSGPASTVRAADPQGICVRARLPVPPQAPRDPPGFPRPAAIYRRRISTTGWRRGRATTCAALPKA